MKKLKMVGQVLTKAEQKSVLGGVNFGEIYYGACNNGTNCWVYETGADWATCIADAISCCSGIPGAAVCSAYKLSC